MTTTDAEYVVIYDPGPDGYKPGATFSGYDVHYGSSASFSDGTVFERDGKRFIWKVGLVKGKCLFEVSA